MISESYNFEVFLAAMIGKQFEEILSDAEEEIRIAEARSRNVKGAPEQRKRGSGEYSARIKAFLYFMRYASRPGSASDLEFALYRPVCESLVGLGRFDPKFLDLFH